MRKRTWLLFLNYYVFQWFFFRFARILNRCGNQIGWAIIFCFPCTGWECLPYTPKNPLALKISGVWDNENISK